jgi:hypothetical protein
METQLPAVNPSFRNVIEYLINKLETRAKYMKKVKLATISVNSVKDFLENKKAMMKAFSEIEDDLNQGASALKVLNLQNKDLSEQIEQFNKQLNQVISENNAKELNENLIQENNELKRIVEEKDNLINELSEALNKFEDHIVNNENNRQEEFILKDKEQVENLHVEYLEQDSPPEENIYGNLQEVNFQEENIQSERINTIIEDNESKYISSGKRSQESLKNLLEHKETNKFKINQKIKQFFNKNNPQRRTSQDSSVKQENNIQDSIIEKISNSDDLLIHVTKTFGHDFMNKLLNKELGEDFLKAVEIAINNLTPEYESETQVKKSKYNYNTIQEEEEIDSPEIQQKRDILNKLKRNLYETNNKSKTNKSAERLLKTYNKTLGIGRKFMNYTTSSSDYFDKGIATGGISKLDYSENIRKRNLKPFK